MILSSTIQSTQTPRFASARIDALGRTSESFELHFVTDHAHAFRPIALGNESDSILHVAAFWPEG